MSKAYIEDKHFQGDNFSEKRLETGEYENCQFSNCSFLNSDLSGIIFSDCTFSDCDMSMAKLNGTAFREVVFRNCKMLGLRFDACNTFSLSFGFDACLLNFASFFKLSLRGTRFNNCKLEDVEWIETDLSQAVFKQCDFRNAIFEKTILQGADLRSSFNFSIDPENNLVSKAKFSLTNVVGLLDKYKLVIE